MAIPTVAEVITEIQDLLGDLTAKVFTSGVATKGYQRAYRRLRTAMVNRQVQFVKKVVTYTLPSGTTSLTPATAGITDFGELVRMEERASGSSDDYTEVVDCENLPQRDQAGWLYEFSWYEDTWHFIGATADRQLKITYFDSGAPPASGSVGIDDSMAFLSTYGAAVVAPTKGYDERGAQLMMQAVGSAVDGGEREAGELLRLMKAMVRTLQRTPIQPKPYGVGQTFRRNVPIPNIAAPPTTGSMTHLTFSGTQDGENATFSLIGVTGTATFQIIKNGLLLKEGVGYTKSGTTITFLPGYIPQSDDVLDAYA